MNENNENKIEFSEVENKTTPEIMDETTRELRASAIRKLEKSQIDKQVRAEAGINEIPKEPESVPPELPKLIFKAGSKIIKCDKFNLEPDEAKIVAKHLSILFGGINSKIYSLFIILVIVISKIGECFDSVKNVFTKKKKDEKPEKPHFDEKTESMKA